MWEAPGFSGQARPGARRTPDAHQYPNIDAARKEAGKTFARGDTFAVANHGQGNEYRLPL